MDDYALQQELEAMAGNAFSPALQGEAGESEPISSTIARWQTLFELSQDEAIDRIMDHRNNLTRIRILDAHWDMLRSEKEADGYDREAYEHELELQKKKTALPNLLPAAEGSLVTYLVELNGPLDSPEKVQQAAEMDSAPPVVSGQSLEEGRQVMLCCIDSSAKSAILRWAAGKGGGFEPTILADPRSLVGAS